MKTLLSKRALRRLSLLAGIVCVTAGGQANAAVYSIDWDSGFAAGTAIPDGNAAGWSDVRAFPTASQETVTDVDVRLSLSAGFNGDLYAYLTHTNAPGVAILLNRPGRTGAGSFGYGDDVLTITLDDSAANGDVHFYQGTPGYLSGIANNGVWAPDGRAVSPLTVDGTEARTALLSIFNGMDASAGQWTLFVADLSTGEAAIVESWGLTVTTIPEAGTSLLAGLAGSVLLLRRKRPA